MLRDSPRKRIEMSLEEIAQKVIKDAIRSAICIDDEYAPPYPQGNSGLNTEEPSKLYYSFREKGNCDLDIYCFESIEKSWKPNYMIPNKDLVILDWELDKEGDKFGSTLQILEDIVNSKKIPFVLIYTNTEDLNQVAQKLISKFNPYSQDKLKEFVSLFVSKLTDLVEDLEETDIEELLEENHQKFYEHFMSFSKRDEIALEIVSSFSLKLDVEPKKAQRIFKAVFKELLGEKMADSGMIEVGKIILRQEDSFQYDIDRIEIDSPALKIGATSVIVYHKQSKKDGIQPEDLFDTFSQAVRNNPHNYLTLLSLEMKDRIREDFSVIGNNFANIDERAFLYHLSGYKQGNEYQINLIYDFIIKSWIEDLAQYNLNRVPEVLKSVTERIEVHNQEVGSKNVSNDPTLIEELVRYSNFISTASLNREKDLTLRFGDIFINSKTNHFYLCITPHCDCLRPDKIQNNFYFVAGTKYDKNLTALEKAETEYSSFVIHKDNPIGIKWTGKPFTAHIQNNDISALTFDYCSEEIQLDHITTLKENHVQRIANQSFGYGYRVGIDLPHISK